MTLNELKTPLERRKAIMYGADGNKIVSHWFNFRHITGTAYMAELGPDEQGDSEFHMAVFFSGALVGMIVSKHMRHPEWYTTEKIAEAFVQQRLDSPDAYIDDLDEAVSNGRFIGGAMIEMAKQIAPSKAEIYAKAREDFYARKHAKEAELKRIRDGEDALKAAAEKAAKNTERAKLQGWADEMTDLRFGKAMATLGSLVRVDGDVMPKHDFITKVVKSGYVPVRKDDIVSCYGSKWDIKESKPRTEYRLTNDEGVFYKISKTEFDYATYLVRSDKIA